MDTFSRSCVWFRRHARPIFVSSMQTYIYMLLHFILYLKYVTLHNRWIVQSGWNETKYSTSSSEKYLSHTTLFIILFQIKIFLNYFRKPCYLSCFDGKCHVVSWEKVKDWASLKMLHRFSLRGLRFVNNHGFKSSKAFLNQSFLLFFF